MGLMDPKTDWTTHRAEQVGRGASSGLTSEGRVVEEVEAEAEVRASSSRATAAGTAGGAAMEPPGSVTTDSPDSARPPTAEAAVEAGEPEGTEGPAGELERSQATGAAGT